MIVIFSSIGLVGKAACSPNARLIVEGSTKIMDWNAVAIVAGHVFVSGPRWTGFDGPAVAEISRHGEIQPFPDKQWNNWRPGLDARHSFVNVNALHLDPSGRLWAVDTGTPLFGGDPVEGGPKIVCIDPTTAAVLRVYPMDKDVAPAGSYIDDIRFNGRHAYLTDAGRGALLVLDLESGLFRRVLDGVSATKARPERPISVDGHILRTAFGSPLLVNADPLEVSPDGNLLYFGTLEGPWSQVPTALLDNPDTAPGTLAAAITPWANLPPIGGSAMDTHGNLYFTALSDDTLYRRSIAGDVTRIASDPRLHWADAPFLDQSGKLWLPAAQLDRLAQFHRGASHIKLPFQLLSLKVARP